MLRKTAGMLVWLGHIVHDRSIYRKNHFFCDQGGTERKNAGLAKDRLETRRAVMRL